MEKNIVQLQRAVEYKLDFRLEYIFILIYFVIKLGFGIVYCYFSCGLFFFFLY